MSPLTQPEIAVDKWQSIAQQNASRLHAAAADIVLVIVLKDIFDVIGIGNQQIALIQQFELGDATIRPGCFVNSPSMSLTISGITPRSGKPGRPGIDRCVVGVLVAMKNRKSPFTFSRKRRDDLPRPSHASVYPD